MMLPWELICALYIFMVVNFLFSLLIDVGIQLKTRFHAVHLEV